jgi:glycerophosphoryl diester phosphodiesterase
MEIIAHRGASWDAPENTLAAARLAWEQGADALELDLHLTRDGRLAVIHDEDLRRTTGDPRRVAEATLAELQALDAGRWKGAKFAGEKIPDLAAVLAVVPRGRRVFIEIKGGPEVVAELTRVVSASGLAAGQVVVISFDHLAAQAAKRALPQHEAAWIIDAPEAMGESTLGQLLQISRELALDALDFEGSWPIDEGFVQQIHGQRFKLYVWTVDDARKARRLLLAGVDGVTTNRPGWLRAQLGT